MVSKEDWEASLPESFHKEEERRKAEEEQAKLSKLATPKTPGMSGPVGRGNQSKRGRKGHTPKSSKLPSASQAAPSDGSSGMPSAGLDANHVGGSGADATGGGHEKKLIKLPEAQFSEIDDYEIENAPPMSASYYRYASSFVLARSLRI